MDPVLREAVQGIGFELLLVCGIAFDPHVSEEAKWYSKLTNPLVWMNPDLSMGEDLLKKIGAGNLFMVFVHGNSFSSSVTSPSGPSPLMV